MGFMQQLRQRWDDAGTLVCVGLDPEPAKFPARFRGDPDGVFARKMRCSGWSRTSTRPIPASR